MNILNYLQKNKILILTLTILGFLFISIYSICFGMEEIEALDFSTGQVTAKRLNIRRGPGINFENVGILSENSYIRVFAKIGNWYVVQTENNIIGAVCADYIKPCYDIDATAMQTSTTPVDTPAISTILSTEEEEFLKSINEIRVKNNLPELIIDDAVQNVARLKAQDLIENNYFSHTSPKYGTPFEMLSSSSINYKTASENIAGNSTISGAIDSWMNSESHKNNILSNDFNYTGVAVVHSNTYGKVLVQMFIGK